MHITLLSPSPQHIPELKSSIKEFFHHECIDQSDLNIDKALKELLTQSNLGQAWLISLDGKIIGHAILTFSFDIEFGGKEAWITDLFLTPQYRGKKIGKVVLDLIFAEAKKLSIGAIHLQVREENSRAFKLYSDFGFVKVPRTILSKNV